MCGASNVLPVAGMDAADNTEVLAGHRQISLLVGTCMMLLTIAAYCRNNGSNWRYCVALCGFGGTAGTAGVTKL